MSRVIKNNDGVAVVEGTPAASLVKDIDKFFATKPPERMAGESISQPRTMAQAIKTSKIRGRRPSFENLSVEEQAEITARREQMMEDRRARDTEPLVMAPPLEVNENKIMSKAEYEADATRRIKEEKKRGRAISPMPYSMYLERQQPGFKEKQAAGIQKEKT